MTKSDLSLLGRAAVAEPPGDGHVPPPSRHLPSRVLVPGAILLCFGALAAWSGRDALWPAREVEVSPVVTRPALEQGATGGSGAPGKALFTAAGWVEPDPYPVEIAALADGIVQEVLVLEGESVTEGQEIVRLVDEDARLARDRARAELARQQALVAAAEADLTATQTAWDNPVERERAVATARAGVERAQAELVQQERDVETARAEVAEHEETERRETPIAASSVIPEYQLVQTRLKLATARARLAGTEARRSVLAAELDSARADLHAAERDLDLRIEEKQALANARADVERAAAERDLAAAQLAEAELRLARMVIRSPMDGVVLRRLTNPGSKLMAGMDSPHSAHAVHLYDPTRLQVRVDVPLADAAAVGVGQSARIVVEVLPDRTFEGVVTRVVNEADLQKNTLQVKVAISKPERLLKPEMLARVQFLSGGGEASGAATASTGSGIAVYAPEALILEDAGGRTFAWVVDKGAGRARHREVTVGSDRRNGHVEVVEGLSPGDHLIHSPVSGEALSDGERVRVTVIAGRGGQHGSH